MSECPAGEYEAEDGSACVSSCTPGYINPTADGCLGACASPLFYSSNDSSCTNACPSSEFVLADSRWCVAAPPRLRSAAAC